MKTIQEMARESHLDVYGLGRPHEKFMQVLERFAALVREDAQRKPLSLDELEALWNSQADHMNQWDELGLDEIVAFAQAAHGIKE